MAGGVVVVVVVVVVTARRLERKSVDWSVVTACSFRVAAGGFTRSSGSLPGIEVESCRGWGTLWSVRR